MSAQPKAKRCRVCREPFTPRNSLAVVCDAKCGIEYARRRAEARAKRREREARAERRVARRELMTARDWTKVAQAAVNAYVRERDSDQPCICCGRWTSDARLITGSRWDAGHYRSTGAAPHLRFNEDNIARQLVHCNRYRSGRAVEFRKGLIARIGIKRVEALENDNSIKRWTIEELQEIAKLYRAKTRELKRAKKIN